MDPPAPSPADARHERRRSIGNMFKRMRTLLRRRPSTAGSPGIAAAGETEPISTVETASKVQAPEPSAPVDVPTASAPVSQHISAAMDPDPIVEPVMAESPTFHGFYVSSLEQQERARLLFARYGLSFDDDDFVSVAPPIAVQRVERPIRMRVHRTCHRCQTTFGLDKTCSTCQHKRCKKCPRYPARKVKDGSRGVREGKAPKPDPDAEKLKQKKREPLTVKRQGDAPDLTYLHPRQRVRRLCHKCDTLFNPPTAVVCAECQHVRCSKCPRQPAKLEKYPQGYPGDVPGEDSDAESRLQFPYVSGVSPPRMYRKPRIRVRWICEQCETAFRRPGTKCEKCSHEQCENCTRIPQKKKKEPDPGLLESLNDKLAQLQVQKTTEEWVQSTS